MEAAVANRELPRPAESDPNSWDTSEGESDGELEQAQAAPEAAHHAEPDAPLPHLNGDAGGENSGVDSDAAAGAEDEDEDAQRRRSHAHASGSEADEEDREGEGGHNRQQGDNKAASFARAFAKIMATGTTGKGILSASKSVSKRKREEEATEASEKEAKALKREMRQRGHVGMAKKGDDPDRDAREKALSRLATRGVVRLFNAVAKAQRARKEAEEGGAKRGAAEKLSKASFLAELRGQQQQGQGQVLQPHARLMQKPGPAGEQLLPSRPAAAATEGPERAAASGSGWAVLQGDGIVGAKGTGTRLKDWDQMAESSEEEDGIGAGADDDSDSE